MVNSTIIQKFTNHVATLSTGHSGYKEFPISNEKPKYKIIDINTLEHNVAHTYHPEITELIPQTNYAPQGTDETYSSHLFSVHQVIMTDPSDKEKRNQLLITYNPHLILLKHELFLHYRSPKTIETSITKTNPSFLFLLLQNM